MDIALPDPVDALVGLRPPVSGGLMTRGSVSERCPVRYKLHPWLRSLEVDSDVVKIFNIQNRYIGENLLG